MPTVADVVDAEARLRGWLVETPVLESEAINRRVGTRVLFKAECLQHTGSFKIRGALNRLLQLERRRAQRRRRRVLVGQSRAGRRACRALARRCRATIVMPADAPAVKLERTRELGAEVVLYDREREDREAIAVSIAEQRGAALVPPFDHPHIIAGQGTLALELARAARDAAPRDRRALRAVQRRRPRRGLRARDQGRVAELRRVRRRAARLRGSRRVARGRRATHARARQATTLCDGLRAPTPGAITFAINAARARRRASPSTTRRFATPWPSRLGI